MNLTQQNGLYTPQLEKDSCGVGLIADLNATPTRYIIESGLTMLENMKHRGACGYESNTGDGAGMLLQIPHEFFQNIFISHNRVLPPKGKYGVGMFYFPKDPAKYKACMEIIDAKCKQKDFKIIYDRNVPTNNADLGKTAKDTEPLIKQLIVKTTGYNNKDIENRLYFLRNIILKEIYVEHPELFEDFYIASFSSRTIVYKGMLMATQLRTYFEDMQAFDFKSAIAIIHSRFSTNTLPKWKLAQPFRCIAHNGEINTIQGNLNWWKARENNMSIVKQNNAQLNEIFPVCDPTISDSGNFDNVIDFLLRASRSIPHAMMMMIPESWQNDPDMSEYKKAFYKYHDALMEPWDGPASICFTDGSILGATLDRNGLRPSRYVLTKDNILVLGSEAGCLEIPEEEIVLKKRLEPGKMLVADLDEQRIITDDEVKETICKRKPYQQWLENNQRHISELSAGKSKVEHSKIDLTVRQIAFGLSKEDCNRILASMCQVGKEPIGSMGSDIPLAVLSKFAQHPSNYFKQQFAQVTNPPIDPIREAFYMSLKTALGAGSDIIGVGEQQAKTIVFDTPIVSESELEKLVFPSDASIESYTIPISYRKTKNILDVIKKICDEVEFKVRRGTKFIRLTDRFVDKYHINIPSLLITGAIHNHLIDRGLRKEVVLVIDAGDIWEAHHFACLLSFGADLICPHLALEACAQFDGPSQAIENYIKAAGKGILKIMSKLGISTLNSYKGAQTFEALGVDKEVIDLCFKNTISRIGGLKLKDFEKENRVKHHAAFHTLLDKLPDLGNFRWIRKGEYHLFNPQTIHLLQFATQKNDYLTFKKFSKSIDQLEQNNSMLRSYLRIKKEGSPIPINKVESEEKILKRFATGAMSFGSLSYEAHTALARAMNAIGGKSNSGEGGEDEKRYTLREDGQSENSAIKQVASGRFGVTSHYLSQAQQIQIKMAQGAKPGEGGQLPGHKVNDWIARVRNSTPGVGLISPPPHHDIYSIEDLAQLIFDLKNANEQAEISVKLVSKAGVGVIASGVAKAHADHILISGSDGGTGASPLSSIRHAGLPWEIGLSEAHQSLVRNGLRDRVRLQVDGQIRTGRDLAIATMLGAEEWGIATAALVVEGCILMRKCHLNTCPVGIATQDEELRSKFTGKTNHLINYFRFLARELREYMAELGIQKIDDLVGRTDLLEIKNVDKHWKTTNLNLETILHKSANTYTTAQYCTQKQDHDLEKVLDKKLVEVSSMALKHKGNCEAHFPIKNTDRAVGAMLGNRISQIYGSTGMEDNSLVFHFKGSAGQSFGAFAARGMTFKLEGESNDYFGKGLSGGRLIVKPDSITKFKAHENIIIGNVALYGATSGQAFINGIAGDRFAVRNSGVRAVVEGVGHNGCEYMTGGVVIILGPVGNNFGAGMSGGTVYMLKEEANKISLKSLLHSPLDTTDESLTQELIREHVSMTGSQQGMSLLFDWAKQKDQFVKLIPEEYKRAMDRLHLQSQIA